MVFGNIFMINYQIFEIACQRFQIAHILLTPACERMTPAHKRFTRARILLAPDYKRVTLTCKRDSPACMRLFNLKPRIRISEKELSYIMLVQHSTFLLMTVGLYKPNFVLSFPE
jgi:hypothetical protein